jgi:tartrate dehydratase beta subunit/fumarate hydratase class I family protein
MKIRNRFLTAIAVCSMGVAPFALADASIAHTGPVHPAHPTHPASPTTAQTRAFGKFCQGESKKHVAGQKGTPFSQCVTAMAKLAHGTSKSPSKACAGLSKKHVANAKSTPYSLCVAGGAKLLKESRQHS